MGFIQNFTGEELYISDYESAEGFKKSDLARDVTHEIAEEDDEDKEIEEESELYKSLVTYLQESANTYGDQLLGFIICQ